jgi:hypothetical protein
MYDSDFESLYFQLALMTEDERKEMPFALFVVGKGILNGSEAFKYLKDCLHKGN